METQMQTLNNTGMPPAPCAEYNRVSTVSNEWDEFANNFVQAPRRTPPTAAKPMSTSPCDARPVTLITADHYPIGAIRYDPPGPARAHLIVAGATSVPQRFYRRFACFAAARGYSTLTFDYRGIGLSAPASLRGFKMNYLDWGQLDLAAAVDNMSSTHVPLYIVGHSVGGHTFGLLPNHEKVARLYTFGTGAGWHGWMPPLERIRVLALWHVLGPLLTTWKGYLSWSVTRTTFSPTPPCNTLPQASPACAHP
jgi:predicted alpha/beta hydrolase